ncbi:hypothetical protein [Streptomyces subrutilus]|uniref:Histidine phosphatase family protein n=2 Tax=Streptomyces subrutilus TaxID=36818 RepID=A0A918QN81_9ACTN|nr:hypothetical protein [Streptomyces subrutilus]WSJ33065.1 hypothetical protein OG479_29315 [Streptomyces subrutilus]GGZ62284.1 hypothetical protein GCM10010371_22110 [Streptomyces subrutilus]
MPHASTGSGPRRRSVLAAALAPLAVAGCSAQEDTRPAAGPAAGPQDALVMVIRHAEKPYPGDTGEDEDGNEHPGTLAGRGQRRAEELARLFPPAASASLPRPATVFAAGGKAAAERCRQTVAPLAAALHTPVRAEFAAGAERDLAKAVLAAPTPVLVCWEPNGIPRLVRALGAHRLVGVPAAWPDRYDLVWMFTRRQGRWSFRELSQHLLPGDA